MKAIVLHEFGGPGKLRFEDVDDPKPGEGEVLVSLAATSVNPVDYKIRSGALQSMMPVELPTILGRDLSGVIRELGPGVTGFATGDRVMALANHTYAQFAVVKASLLNQIPDDLAIVDAAALPLICITGEQLISRGIKPQKGQTILIAGALGSVGRAAVFCAKEAGAIVIAGVRKHQLDEARDLKADDVVALNDKSAMEKLGQLDAIGDAVGGETADLLLGKVKQGGTFATLLGPPANAKRHPTVHIEHVMATPDPAALRTLAEAAQAKRLTIPIDRMVPLADAGEAQTAVEKGGIGKVLLLA